MAGPTNLSYTFFDFLSLLFYHLAKAGAFLLSGADEARAVSIHALIEKERDLTFVVLMFQPAYLVLELRVVVMIRSHMLTVLDF